MTDSTKLQINGDGSVTIPLIGERKGQQVVLHEPSMRQLAEIHALMAQADEALPNIRVVNNRNDAAEVQAALEDAKKRQAAMFSVDAPHGTAFVKMIEMLTEAHETVTLDDLPGWCANPAATQQILQHFTAPLGGGAAPGA